MSHWASLAVGILRGRGRLPPHTHPGNGLPQHTALHVRPNLMVVIVFQHGFTLMATIDRHFNLLGSVIVFNLVCFCCLSEALCQETSRDAQLPNTHAAVDMLGDTTNDLQPILSVQQNGAQVTIAIDFLAHRDFDKYAWLKIPNHVGATLDLRRTNGEAISLKNREAITARDLPKDTTVSNIMERVRPSSWAGMQWWKTGIRGTVAGETQGAATFVLNDEFNLNPTDDCVLTVAPLMYRVNTNLVTARLVEFPPIQIRISTNGVIEKIGDPSKRNLTK